jgi:hypothetical protein
MAVFDWTKKISLLILLSIGCSPLLADEKAITLERPNVERFEETFKRYGKVASMNTTKKIIGYGILGTVVIGGGGYLIYKTFSDSDSSSGSSYSGYSGGYYHPGSGFFVKFKEALLSTLAFSLSALLLDTMYTALFGAGGVLKAIFSRGGKKISELAPFVTSLSNSMKRLKVSMTELHRIEKGQWLYEHYMAELVSSQKIFVHTLESICATVLWNAQKVKKNKGIILADCKEFILRLFVFCNKVVDVLERDLQNEKWRGFGQDAFDLVQMLEKVSLSFIGDHSTSRAS